jgi:hypothetical protein
MAQLVGASLQGTEDRHLRESDEPSSIHSWSSPHNLREQDDRITVDYQAATDTLAFTGMDGMDENYIQIEGTISEIRDDPDSLAPAAFTFSAADIGHDIEVFALEGTNAIGQLRQIGAAAVTLVGLRNIDLQAACQGKYVITMLAIDLQPA